MAQEEERRPAPRRRTRRCRRWSILSPSQPYHSSHHTDISTFKSRHDYEDAIRAICITLTLHTGLHKTGVTEFSTPSPRACDGATGSHDPARLFSAFSLPSQLQTTRPFAKRRCETCWPRFLYPLVVARPRRYIGRFHLIKSISRMTNWADGSDHVFFCIITAIFLFPTAGRASDLFLRRIYCS
jgi:hypothetical protein